MKKKPGDYLRFIKYMEWRHGQNYKQKQVLAACPGLLQSTLSNYANRSGDDEKVKGPGMAFIVAILKGHPDLNGHWWLTGLGPMLLHPAPPVSVADDEQSQDNIVNEPPSLEEYKSFSMYGAKVQSNPADLQEATFHLVHEIHQILVKK